MFMPFCAVQTAIAFDAVGVAPQRIRHRAISQTTNGSASTANHTAIMSATRCGVYVGDGRASALARCSGVVR